jgi:hypothetical protein
MGWLDGYTHVILGTDGSLQRAGTRIYSPVVE